MTSYISRRKRWWLRIKALDSGMVLPDKELAKQDTAVRKGGAAMLGHRKLAVIVRGCRIRQRKSYLLLDPPRYLLLGKWIDMWIGTHPFPMGTLIGR